MAVNFNKHKETLLAAWKDVLDDKSTTDWALFGYEGQTNDLKVVGKGSGGIDEMIEDFNSGKIMYAFCKILDPKTSLPKCVLINWQGEGAPIVRKGTCANHIRDVSNFFKGAHVTLHARNEEEVDPQLIIDKVSKSTGSAYSFKERGEHETGSGSGPVGTTYKKVVPLQEINATERDKFWEKEENEEKQRQAEEKHRRDQERRKLEEEQRQREVAETALREEKTEARSKTITQIRAAERRAQEAGGGAGAGRPDRPFLDDRSGEEERRGRTDALRRQRSQEAQSLISQRTVDARAIFEQNTSAGQLHRPPRGGALPPAPPAGEDAPASPAGNGISEPADHGDSSSTPAQHKRVAFQEPQANQYPEEEEEDDTVYLGQPAGAEQHWDGTNYNGADDLGLQARALYDYQAADSTELTFDPGDVITHIDQIDEGWWQGLGPDGLYGLFPANYVELIN